MTLWCVDILIELSIQRSVEHWFLTQVLQKAGSLVIGRHPNNGCELYRFIDLVGTQVLVNQQPCSKSRG